MNVLRGIVSGVQGIRGTVIVSTGGIGTDDYEDLRNKPCVSGVELVGDKSLPEIGVDALTNEEIEALIKLFV